MMKESVGRLMGRREVLQTSAAAFMSASLADGEFDSVLQSTKTASKPSELKTTDLRVAVVARAPMTCPIIRIDTNQVISGFGEVRDGASKTYALMLKGRLLGENLQRLRDLQRWISLRQRFTGMGNRSRRKTGGKISFPVRRGAWGPEWRLARHPPPRRHGD